jgi:hypothetical protein
MVRNKQLEKRKIFQVIFEKIEYENIKQFHAGFTISDMDIQSISAGASAGGNEDLVAVYHGDGVTDIVVIDGGTSVADENYIDRERGDVVWFVTHFARALEQANHRDRPQQESVALALRKLRSVFLDQPGAAAMPLYAYPIAAMTWLRLREGEAGMAVQAYCLGDCKAFVQRADGSVLDLDPYVNPQELVLQSELARLAAQGVAGIDERRARLMPMLRARREFLNTAPAPTVLCLDPRGPLIAREHSSPVPRGSTLLAMTDGFYRMVDTYDMHTVEELAALCRAHGLETMMQRLRAFEAGKLGSGSLSVKRADDASAVMCTV